MVSKEVLNGWYEKYKWFQRGRFKKEWVRCYDALMFWYFSDKIKVFRRFNIKMESQVHVYHIMKGSSGAVMFNIFEICDLYDSSLVCCNWYRYSITRPGCYSAPLSCHNLLTLLISHYIYYLFVVLSFRFVVFGLMHCENRPRRWVKCGYRLFCGQDACYELIHSWTADKAVMCQVSDIFGLWSHVTFSHSYV